MHRLLNRLRLSEDLDSGRAEVGLIWGRRLRGQPYNGSVECPLNRDLKRNVNVGAPPLQRKNKLTGSPPTFWMTEVNKEFLLPWLEPPGGCWSPSFKRTNAIWAGTTVATEQSDRSDFRDVIGMHTVGVCIVFGELDRSRHTLLSLVCEVKA